MGTPLKLVPSLIKRLVDTRRTSMLSDVDVCTKCGVSKRTVEWWVKEGLKEDAREPYLSFAEDWTRSKIAVKERLLARIDKASQTFKGKDATKRGDYKAAAWQLARMAPKEFGSMVEHQGEQAGTIDVERLLEEATQEAGSLDSVLLAPPQSLIDAFKRNLPAIRAILDQIDAEDIRDP